MQISSPQPSSPQATTLQTSNPQTSNQAATNSQSTPPQSIALSGINHQTYADIVKSVTTELRREISKINNNHSPIEETIKNLYNSMLTPEVKDSHFIELERLIEKKQNFTTRETVLSATKQTKSLPVL